MKLYFAPRTRSVRVRWLLLELDLPHTLEIVPFDPNGMYGQATPLGKLPVLEDEGLVICESGAIMEYILERHGDGKLAPPIGHRERGKFLQWMHYAESTLYSPLGILIWHTLYRRNADRFPEVMADARARTRAGLKFLESQLGERSYLLDYGFSAADIMTAFTLLAARALGVLDSGFPRLNDYLTRLEARPAFTAAQI